MGNRNPRVRNTIMIVAGAYLIYLGISSLRDVIKGTSGISLALAVVIAVVLAGFGAAFVIIGGKEYLYMKKHPEEFEEQDDEPEESEEEASGETVDAPAQGGLLQKASMPEHLRVSEDDDQTDEEEGEKEDSQSETAE